MIGQHHPPEEGFVDSDGVRLHTLDWGGDGRLLVLLAGLGDNAQRYRSLAPRLTDRFRVVGLTRRGHGRSDRPAAGYDLDTLVEDIRRFLDAVGIEQAILVGHSFAGLEMPLLATRYPRLGQSHDHRRRPRRVSSRRRAHEPHLSNRGGWSGSCIRSGCGPYAGHRA